MDLANAKTVQDVIDRINNNPANDAVPTNKFSMRLAQTGNGSSCNQTGRRRAALVAEGARLRYWALWPMATQSNPRSVHVRAGHQVLTSEIGTLKPIVFSIRCPLKTSASENDNEEIADRWLGWMRIPAA